MNPSLAPENCLLYDNITELVTMRGVARKGGRNVSESDLDIIHHAAVIVDATSNLIAWLGARKELPDWAERIDNRVDDNEGIWFPELVECHTHLVYGGTRYRDYALRCGGMTYAQVAEAGGGILSTLAHTREASERELFENAKLQLDRFQKYGVGVIECKSGYGLSLESELKLLSVIGRLGEDGSVRVVPTFLPAHAVPPEFKGRSDDYVDVICQEWLPEVASAKLARFFDVFVEQGYFSVPQARKMCLKAKELGLGVKIHADQFSDTGASLLAVEMAAVSADHLDNLSSVNIKRLAESNTVAVLCPGASLFTATSYPPARQLIDSGAVVAISTDFNPGTAPTRNLPLMTTLACSQMKMTVPEAVAAITYNAAKALGLESECGVLDVGREFRVCTLRSESYLALPYAFGELD